ncbi:hypothetical protein Tdes44962_MAKER09698 [Teratosphaeria destructans]|uniref:Uncharacterized protein n=1 Tax=Teratosphaeria destructans TaxID=418781 RepID=A0A9W7SS47_9PEZI|nr:hypothetical protein Tdes44962_MAKER09698 [Teratosphaeria destructans]
MPNHIRTLVLLALAAVGATAAPPVISCTDTCTSPGKYRYDACKLICSGPVSAHDPPPISLAPFGVSQEPLADRRSVFCSYQGGTSAGACLLRDDGVTLYCQTIA